ncbi:hypothetical protein KSK55_09270 [Methanospirillum purgamenti]|uniref:Uncharacterized protein n=1 Tax=Methanospirillum hungatei TaxID=2203 RepID=A0A8F5ZFM4_METHU|nr:hypothetical protein [Methanospirillum hungatei]QXO93569.1 hypothetical protein KSK55_09270 [Methanospirillum hungatei]
MEVTDLTYAEIKDISVSEYLSGFQYIHIIKANRPKIKKKREHAYEGICSALSRLTGNLTDYIIQAREERI